MLAQAICSHFSTVVENEFKSCNGGFALALSPGFFGFYSHIGTLIYAVNSQAGSYMFYILN